MEKISIYDLPSIAYILKWYFSRLSSDMMLSTRLVMIFFKFFVNYLKINKRLKRRGLIISDEKKVELASLTNLQINAELHIRLKEIQEQL